MTYEEKVAQYSQVKQTGSENIFLARNSDKEFFKILRRQVDGENANFQTFNDRMTYEGSVLTSKEDLLEEYAVIQNGNPERRKLSDSPSCRSERLLPPFEDEEFDRLYFDFISEMVGEMESVADFGGGHGHFLNQLQVGVKTLVEKNGIGDILPEKISYVDTDDFFAEKSSYDHIFSYHTIEHLSEPEDTIRKLVQMSNRSFTFASPLMEIIESSINHYVYVEKDVIKNILKELKVITFYHTSPIDIHCIVFKDKSDVVKYMKHPFIQKYWKPL